METSPDRVHRAISWFVHWGKFAVKGALRALEITISVLGALFMLVVIGFVALWDYAFG